MQSPGFPPAKVCVFVWACASERTGCLMSRAQQETFCVCFCLVWAVWHLPDGSYYLRLPSLEPPIPCEDFFFLSPFFLTGSHFKLRVLLAGAKRMCATPESARTTCCICSLPLRRLTKPSRPRSTHLRACLTFHNCIITRSVSSRRKWMHRKFSAQALAPPFRPLPRTDCGPGRNVFLIRSSWFAPAWGPDTRCRGRIKLIGSRPIPRSKFSQAARKWICPSEGWGLVLPPRSRNTSAPLLSRVPLGVKLRRLGCELSNTSRHT